MTREILEKYIAYRGMKLWKGGATSTQVFMPFMCMDAAYQIFSTEFLKHIKSYRHEQKKWLKHIDSCFLRFFTEFNIPFDEDELDEIGRDQDKFFAHINTQLMMMKVALSNGCSHLAFEQQMVISNMHMINILAACASVFWEDTFHSRSVYRGDQNNDIEGVKGGSKNFMSIFLPEDLYISEKDNEQIEAAKTVLCARMADFTKNHQKVN